MGSRRAKPVKLVERKSVQQVLALLDAKVGAPAHTEDLSSLEHDMEVFVNRWCSLFGNRAKALAELRELVARVRA